VSGTDNDANDISITVTAGDIEVDTINAGGTAGDVTLTANTLVGQSVTDANNNSLITADVLTVTVRGSVGAAAPNEINTSVNTLNIASTTAGNVYIAEANGVSVTGISLAGAGNLELITVNGTISLDGAVTAAGPGAMSLTANGAGSDVDINANVTGGTGTITITAADIVYLGANITTTGTSISIPSPVEVDAALGASVGSGPGGGNISFGSTIDSAAGRGLTLTAGTGNLSITGPVGGGTRLGAFTVASVTNFLAAPAITAASITQTAGTGTTTFAGALNTNAGGGIDLNGNIININAGVTTTNAGPVVITNGGLLTIAAAGDMNLDGLFRQDGGGAVATSGDITTTADDIRFDAAVSLAGGVVLSTGAGVGTVQFAGTLNGNQNLEITAGTGNIIFTGIVGGGTPLNTITIQSATDVTAAAVSAASILQVAGSGTTTFNGAVNTSGAAGIDLNGTIFTFNNTVTTAAGGPVTITNAGLLTVSDVNGAADTGTFDFTLDGAFTQDGGGAVSIAGDISTTDDGIAFSGAVTLTGNVALSTGAGAGNVAFSLTLTGQTAGAQTLSVNAGTGIVTFTGAVGAIQLGAVAINTASGGTTASSTFSAVSLTITNGGAVDLNGAVTVPDGFSSTGAAFTSAAAASITTTDQQITINHTGNVIIGGALTSGAGAVNIDATGGGATITLNAPISVSTGAVTLDSAGATTVAAAGDITATGAATVDFGSALAGTLSTSRNVTTLGGNITFHRAVTLTGNVALSTGAAAVGNILFQNAAEVGGSFNLTLTAGTGNVSFGTAAGAANGRIGGAAGANRIGVLNITSAAGVTTNGEVYAGSIAQAAGTGTTTFHNLLNTNAAGGIDLNGTNFTFNGTVTTTAGGPVTITHNGVLPDGLLDINAGANFNIAGPFMQDGTGNVDVAADITTANANISFNSNVHVTGASSWNAGSAAITNLGTFDLHVYMPGASVLSIYSNITVRNFVLYRGVVNLNPTAAAPKNLSTVQDLVLFGAGYNQDDDDADDGAGGATTAGIFAYNYAGRTAAATRAAPSVTAVPTAYLAAAPYSLPAPAAVSGLGGYGAAAFDNLASSIITVGKNFYTNGTNLVGNPTPHTGNWTLVISSDVGNAAAAFAEAYNLTVNYSQATRQIAAAEGVTAVAVPAAGGNLNWDTTRAVLVEGDPITSTGTYTVYDNVIRVEFSKPIENSNNEINEVIGYTTSVPVSNLLTNGETVVFTGAFTDPECTISTDGQGDLTVFYLRVADANRWNTDATGSSAGDADSTDRGRPGVPAAHRTTVPDIWFFKTGADPLWGYFLFRDVNKNRMGSTAQETADATAGYTGGRFTSVADGTRPVLVAVQAGRAPYDEDSTGNPLTFRPYDSHNYLHMRYSEPVNIGTGAAFLIGSGAPAENARAQTSFGAGENGGHFSASGGAAIITGFLSYEGGVTPGSRDGTAATSSLYRASPNGENPSGDHGLTIYISGYSFTSGGSRFWPGYHSDLTDPVGKAVTSPANPFITDTVGNSVEPTANPYAKYSVGIGSTPRTAWNPANASSGVGMPASNLDAWDTDPPGFSPYSKIDNSEPINYEIVSRATTVTNLVNRLEFFIQDNSAEAALWDPINNSEHPYPLVGLWNDGVPRGVRDSTMNFPDALDEFKAFRVEQVGIEPLRNDFNTGFATDVNNILFTPAPPKPVFNGNKADDPYFTLTMQDTGHPWGLISELYVTYNSAEAFITDLAGNLLPSATAPLTVIERVPPRIDLTLASVGDDRVYVKFSEPVYGHKNKINEIDFAKFQLEPSASGLAITGIQPITRGESDLSVWDAWFSLNRNLTADEAMSIRIVPEGAESGDPTKGIWDVAENAMLVEDIHRITDVGLGVVTPLWASDGFNADGQEAPLSSASLRTFDGTGRLRPNDIILQAKIEADTFVNLPLALFYDADIEEQYYNREVGELRNFPDIWLPIRISGLNPLANVSARSVFPYTSSGALKNFLIPRSDPEMVPGKRIDFVMRLGSLFCARLTDPENPTSLAPWSFNLDRGKTQRGGVSIFNNVINPENGEKAVLTYELTRSGMVTAQVFSLDGSLVYVLHRGNQGKGNYTYTWSGRNMGNRIVARGIYFIRVVGPDMDEIRKVMVVK
jgi:hypothetical protein